LAAISMPTAHDTPRGGRPTQWRMPHRGHQSARFGARVVETPRHSPQYRPVALQSSMVATKFMFMCGVSPPALLNPTCCELLARRMVLIEWHQLPARVRGVVECPSAPISPVLDGGRNRLWQPKTYAARREQDAVATIWIILLGRRLGPPNPLFRLRHRAPAHGFAWARRSSGRRGPSRTGSARGSHARSPPPGGCSCSGRIPHGSDG
jgi:hypothetical protein